MRFLWQSIKGHYALDESSTQMFVSKHQQSALRAFRSCLKQGLVDAPWTNDQATADDFQVFSRRSKPSRQASPGLPDNLVRRLSLVSLQQRAEALRRQPGALYSPEETSSRRCRRCLPATQRLPSVTTPCGRKHSLFHHSV